MRILYREDCNYFPGGTLETWRRQMGDHVYEFQNTGYSVIVDRWPIYREEEKKEYFRIFYF